MLKSDGLIFVNSTADISNVSVKISGDSANVRYTQEDTYRTEVTVESGDDRTATSEVTPRVAKFQKGANGWELQSVALEGAAPIGGVLNFPSADRVDEWSKPIAASFAAADPSVATAVTSKGVDRGKVINYALTYALSPNPVYRRFSQDCTNFVSQALYSGGWKMLSGGETDGSKWWYNLDGLTRWSHTWSVANDFYYFGRWRSGRLANIDRNVVWLGDVISIDLNPTGTKGDLLDHTVVATGRISGQNGWNSLLVSYHTSNKRNYPITAFMRAEPGSRYLPLRVL